MSSAIYRINACSDRFGRNPLTVSNHRNIHAAMRAAARALHASPEAHLRLVYPDGSEDRVLPDGRGSADFIAD